MRSSVTENSTKRRRFSAADSSSPICLSSNLPTGIIASVSSFLASPSRALFAVALKSRDVERCSAIVGGGPWDALDFGDIEKDLAAKLSDDDISGVLLCIDAVSNLKKLRLTNCIKITGVGLEPLRGSVIIEKIDLSLVGFHESPDLNPEPPISCNTVLPILDSIVERGEECALKLLTFPKVWRRVRNAESDFHAFLGRYNDMLENRGVSCLECSCNLPSAEYLSMIETSTLGDVFYYGTQNYTCYDCMKNYCDDCQDDNGDAFERILCRSCERYYCLNCSRGEGQCTTCDSCDSWFCVDCGDFKQCTECQESTCPDCVSEMECYNCGANGIWCRHCSFGWKGCEDCNTIHCVDCCGFDVYAVKFCHDCAEYRCGRCRVHRCNEGRDCRECYLLAFPVLMGDKEKLREEMQSEIDELENQISALKKEIEKK